MSIKNFCAHIAVAFIASAFLIAPPVIAGQISMISPTNGGTYPYESGKQFGYVKFSWSYSETSGYVFYGVKISVDGVSQGYLDSGTPVYVANNFQGHFQGRAELWERRLSDMQVVSTQAINFTFYMSEGVSATVNNSFGGGIVYVNGDPYYSGASVTLLRGSTATFQTDDRQYTAEGGKYYYHLYQNWTDGSGTVMATKPQLSFSTTMNSNRSFTAYFHREYNIDFTSSCPGNITSAIITIGSTGYMFTTPTFPVEETQTFSASVPSYFTALGVGFIFSNWTNGAGQIVSSSASNTFTPTDHATYTANYLAKPLTAPNIFVGGTVGDYVRISWDQVATDKITKFEIWRLAKPLGGQQGSPQIIATISRDPNNYSYQFIDYECTVTSTYSNSLLNYDVRTFYSPNSSYSDPNWIPVFGRMNARQVQEGELAANLGELPTSYSVSNYPNPFNPSTKISYQLIEEANVTLEIYDVMGRKISSLLQEQKQAGYYTAKWEGKDNSGRQVATGAYLYRFSAIPTSGKQPFIKSGKLLLTK